MARMTNTSRLAIVVVAAALAMAASPVAAQEWERSNARYDGAVVLPSPPALPPLPALPALPALPPLPALPGLPPLPALPYVVPHLLRSLVSSLRVAPQIWSDQEYYGPRRYIRGEERVPYLVRPQMPALRVAPRAWSNREVYAPRRYIRGEDRRFAVREEARRNRRYVERRGYREYGDRWR